MGLLAGVLLAFLPPLSLDARVEAERAVERARYAFVIGATGPFGDVFPRVVFEKRVARQEAEAGVLKRVFGLQLTPEQLKAEFERIEVSTKDPDQWAAVKAALGSDRARIEEAVCRPILVSRALRIRFAFDPKIHAELHQQARDARSRLRAGQLPAGAKRLRLPRRPASTPGTDEILQEAKRDAAGPRVLEPAGEPSPEAPRAVGPELASALEQQLQKPGDVSTILSEWDRFSVYRLVEATDEAWTVEAAIFPKRDFEVWFRDTTERR